MAEKQVYLDAFQVIPSFSKCWTILGKSLNVSKPPFSTCVESEVRIGQVWNEIMCLEHLEEGMSIVDPHHTVTLKPLTTLLP